MPFTFFSAFRNGKPIGDRVSSGFQFTFKKKKFWLSANLLELKRILENTTRYESIFFSLKVALKYKETENFRLQHCFSFSELTVHVTCKFTTLSVLHAGELDMAVHCTWQHEEPNELCEGQIQHSTRVHNRKWQVQTSLVRQIKLLSLETFNL